MTTAPGARHRTSGSRPLAALLLALALTGCGAEATGTRGGTAGGGASSSGTGAPAGDAVVTVLAAASVARPLTTLAEAFEQANPGTTVRLGFGASTTLARQVAQGADADLLLSAGTAALEQLGEVEPVAETTIARNTLEIATPPDDPAGVGSLADLAGEDVAVVLCARTVPCGTAADEVLAAAGVRANVVSREVDVSATLAKVTLGEADAALVYHSDVVSAGGRVRGVQIPAARNTVLIYPLARFGTDAATVAFASYLAGPEALDVLRDAGFLAP